MRDVPKFAQGYQQHHLGWLNLGFLNFLTAGPGTAKLGLAK